MCRTVLTNSSEGQAMAEQMNSGILIMIAAPYLVFGTVGVTLFRGRIAAAWRERRRRASVPGAPAPSLR
jgi:hypothetical protein